jgi:hypothetical protein
MTIWFPGLSCGLDAATLPRPAAHALEWPRCGLAFLHLVRRCAEFLKRERIRPTTGVKQTGTHLALGSLEKGADPGSKGGFWPLHCVTAGGMEKRQITRQELVAAALKLGARPGTIRQWFHRAIPYRWQIRLMEYFEGPVEISDWAPEATAAIAKPSIAASEGLL